MSNLFWQEDKQEDPQFKVPDDVVDVSFRIDCRALPIDHAWALSQALQAVLPWLADEPQAGVHLIHGAESGNGWYRPEDAGDQLLQLSRRTRMMLRLPKTRLDEGRALEGQVLDIDGHPLTVGASTVKPLSALPTLFARYVVTDADNTEEQFLSQLAEAFGELGIPVRKLMCGRSHNFRTPDGVIHTRSVMAADLEPEPAVILQQQGIGPGRKMGFGLFLPHKGIKPVKETQ